MIFHIPTIGQKIRLVSDWTFTVYGEGRNDALLKVLGLHPKPEDGWYFWHPVRPVGSCTLPAGCVLTVSRIYVRNGLKDYDSVTFILNKKGCPDERFANWKGGRQIRFWAKLDDVNNNILFELVDDKKVKA